MKRRQTIEREKENVEREKQELMSRLYQYEETTKRTERGEIPLRQKLDIFCVVTDFKT